ncbi:Methionine--tRNA ligase [Gossypium arboreum]|uniref:Methionine--tRNA ligase n=1 Tax=Gossypium arboreum TaxID=29729 RepID=A0A0B0MZ10_GOSAR|nr:Methionine--tRNA ligase [Gossypium arboreum]KHG17500.1 Methionine--tRNA ligase [Gossypium arboreum]
MEKSSFEAAAVYMLMDSAIYLDARQAFVILNKALKDLQDLDKVRLWLFLEMPSSFPSPQQKLVLQAKSTALENETEGVARGIQEVKVPPKRDEWMTTLPSESKPGVTKQSASYLEAYNEAAALASNEEENTKRMQIWWINIIKKNN